MRRIIFVPTLHTELESPFWNVIEKMAPDEEFMGRLTQRVNSVWQIIGTGALRIDADFSRVRIYPEGMTDKAIRNWEDEIKELQKIRQSERYEQGKDEIVRRMLIPSNEEEQKLFEEFGEQISKRRQEWLVETLLDSLHAAVVEIFVKKGARCRYTTIQNWSSNVYNLVTKRAFVEEEGIMEWVDGNIGSKITMKYPSCYLTGRGARGEILSLALAGSGQHQDAGGKLVFLAPETSGEIISKSVSHSGGRTSYRGLVKVIKSAERVKCNVRCDALILDEKSRSDTYPTMQVDEDNVTIGHEAAVSKINADQLFYLMSRGLTEV